MIRRKLLRGEKVWRGACAFRASFMFCRTCGVKIVGSLRLVMIRVFVGGVGWTRGGRSLRSRDRVREVGGGVVMSIDMVAAMGGLLTGVLMTMVLFEWAFLQILVVGYSLR